VTAAERYDRQDYLRGPLAAEMPREEIWLALIAYSLMGITFFCVVARQARLEYAPEIIVSIVTLLGLGMSGLAFLRLLKRYTHNHGRFSS
jgi:hypothetical protein